MFELITQTFNASVIAVSQLFLSTLVSANPWFESLDIQFQSVQQEIVCSTNLAESFTETLDGVLLSGQNITLHFKFELFEKIWQQLEFIRTRSGEVIYTAGVSACAAETEFVAAKMKG